MFFLTQLISLCVCACDMSSSSSDRAQKLRKLNEFRRAVPYVSQSALRAIFAELNAHGMPDMQQRKHMKESSDHEIASHCAYGQLLTATELIGLDGEPRSCVAVNGLSYIHAAFTQGGSWTDLVMRSLQQHPSSPERPWRVVAYADEVQPSDALTPKGAGRKVWAVYAAFLELGQLMLSKEDARLTFRLDRTSEVAKLAAGPD